MKIVSDKILQPRYDYFSWLQNKIQDCYVVPSMGNKAAESVAFFMMVQNKLHYAVNRQTAAEIIYDRADCEKDFMGLTSFKGADVTLEDVRIAKNYLSEKELKKMNALVSAFFDMAEYQAENHNVIHMSDYVYKIYRIHIYFSNNFLTTPLPIRFVKTVYFLFSKRRRPAGIAVLICCFSAKFLIAIGVEEIVRPEVFQMFIGINISFAYVSASFSIVLLISFVISSK